MSRQQPSMPLALALATSASRIILLLLTTPAAPAALSLSRIPVSGRPAYLDDDTGSSSCQTGRSAYRLGGHGMAHPKLFMDNLGFDQSPVPHTA